MKKSFKIGEIAAGRIPPECGEMEIPGLPEFINAEPDDMGYLVCRETGERISWGDLEQPDEILAAIAARKAEESKKGGAE